MTDDAVFLVAAVIGVVCFSAGFFVGLALGDDPREKAEP